MRVQDPVRTQAATTRRAGDKGGASATTGFASLLGADDAPAAGSVAGAGPVASIDAILAAQQTEDATAGRSRGLKWGRDLLDELENVRRGLLLGTLSLSQLNALATKVQAYQGTGDPNLDSLLAEIELRVAVELAKYGIEIEL